jgi:hypothetical protein
VEKWLRRWRGIFCGNAGQAAVDGRRNDVEFFGGTSPIPRKCVDTIRDLRNTKCAKAKSKIATSVLDELKTNLVTTS